MEECGEAGFLCFDGVVAGWELEELVKAGGVAYGFTGEALGVERDGNHCFGHRGSGGIRYATGEAGCGLTE